MSQSEEDPELKELVTEALEKNGVLASVRAHLRAGVFMALEREHEQSPRGPVHQLISTHDGLLALMLVQDLLEFCQLRHTTSVYKAETGQPNNFSYQGRDAIVNKFKLDNIFKSRNLPLLVQLISLTLSMLKNTSKPQLDNNSIKIDPNINSDSYDTTFTSYSGSPTNEQNLDNQSIQNETINQTKIESDTSKSDSSVTTKDAMELISESISSHNSNLSSKSNGIITDNKSQNASQHTNKTEISKEILEDIPFQDSENSIINKLKASSDRSYSFTDENFSINVSKTSSKIAEESIIQKSNPKSDNESISEIDFNTSDSYKIEESIASQSQNSISVSSIKKVDTPSDVSKKKNVQHINGTEQ